MDSESIGIKPFVFSLIAIAFIEISAEYILPTIRVMAMPWLALATLAVIRIIEIAAVLTIIRRLCPGGLAAIGLSLETSPHGIRKGLLWTAGFGAITGIAGLGLHLAGMDPVKMIRSPIPRAPLDILFYFIVGGVIAPVAEEICFRGVIFKYLRKNGFAPAAVASTLIFVMVHPMSPGIPIPQFVGGLVFAASFEIEKSLLVPIIIHGAGNMAIFSLSLL